MAWNHVMAESRWNPILTYPDKYSTATHATSQKLSIILTLQPDNNLYYNVYSCRLHQSRLFLIQMQCNMTTSATFSTCYRHVTYTMSQKSVDP